MILLLERTRDETQRFLAAVGNRFERFGRSVFVTTCPDLRPFHQSGRIVELLPSLTAIAEDSGRGPWERFAARRLETIRSKWQPRWQLSYGLDWAAYLNRIRTIEEDGLSMRSLS